MSYYRNQLEDWIKEISVNTEKVLDLGGASNPVRKRVKNWDVEECFFFDNGAEEAKVDYMPFDINLSLKEQLAGYMPKDFIFGAVFCLEVFEYVWNPVQAFQNIYQLMNNDSVCYISFPAIYPVHQPYEIDYLRYTKQAILQYCKLVGLEIVSLEPRLATVGRTDLANFYSREGMHPLRQSALPFDIGYMLKGRKLTIA